MMSIAILPIGEISNEVYATIESCLHETYNADVVRLPALPIPGYAYDARRNQYNSILIMREIIRLCPEDAMRLVAVTEEDLFIPMLTFVFGHAQLSGKVAMLSLARLRQEFYGLPALPTLLKSRLTKELLHEVGHTMGLVHCTRSDCAMALSTSVQHIDSKGSRYCHGCHALMTETSQRLRTNSSVGVLKENTP
jgi:archaemetzincin